MRKKEFEPLKLSETESIHYAFCRNITDACKNSVGVQNGTVYYTNSATNKCYYLAGSIDGEGDSKNLWDEIEDKNNVTIGLNISLASGDACATDTTKRYSLRYEILCNPNLPPKEINFFISPKNFSISNCANVIRGESYNACAINNKYRFQTFFESNKYIISFVIILIGILITLVGKKLFRLITILLIGLAAVVLVGIFVIDLVVGWFTDEEQIWITLIVAFILGLCAGVLILKCIDVAFFAVGGALGYVIGIFVYEFIML